MCRKYVEVSRMNSAQIAKILWESKYTVCLSGREMIVDDGIDSMRNMLSAYAIEMEYGYSPEEVFSAKFFNNRTELFYKFYREKVLAQDKEPGRAFTALARLDQMGIVKSTITRQLYDFPRRAGCRRVFNLHGTIHERNCCPRCGRDYSLEYLRTEGKVPLCSQCRVPVHPGVRLLGEMVDIKVISQAAEEVAKADTLLLAGTNMRAEVVQQFIRYYEGNRVIVIHEKEHFSDKEADYTVIQNVSDALTEIAEELRRMQEAQGA